METIELMKIIGTPGIPGNPKLCTRKNVERYFDLAFENRVELLFLKAIRASAVWSDEWQEKYESLCNRSSLTEDVGIDCSQVLQSGNVKHVIFKSFKPYPATPNDTDVVCLGGEDEYRHGLNVLLKAGYKVIGEAPMQTLMYHPSGEGKVSGKKAGGTYYIDFYRGVAVDYYEYLNKADLEPEMLVRQRKGKTVYECRPELELAVVLFHNVFPERTFQLEHFYLTMYAFAKDEFSFEHLVRTSRNSKLERALRYNLSIVDALHRKAYGKEHEGLGYVLKQVGFSKSVKSRLVKSNFALTFNFSGLHFWLTFLSKLRDPHSRKALRTQIWHMKNPKFFMEAFKAAYVRTFHKDIYEHQ